MKVSHFRRLQLNMWENRESCDCDVTRGAFSFGEERIILRVVMLKKKGGGRAHASFSPSAKSTGTPYLLVKKVSVYCRHYIACSVRYISVHCISVQCLAVVCIPVYSRGQVAIQYNIPTVYTPLQGCAPRATAQGHALLDGRIIK